MKLVKVLEDFKSKAKYLSEEYFNDFRQYLKDKESVKLSLPENQYFAAYVKIKWDNTPVLQSLVCTSEKRVYITKDCFEELVGSHTQWNCIVEVEPCDKVLVIG